jgi:hypothetical protein
LPLSVDAVVDTATALDTGPASLYVYVSGREGLLQAMLDRVIATIELEPAVAVDGRMGSSVKRARLSVAGDQRLAIASRTAGTTACSQRFSVVSSSASPPGGTR